MKTNNQNSISAGVAIGKTAGLVATIIVFAVMMFLIVFLFAMRASAQDFSRFSVPSAVCQEYRSQAGYSIENDTTNDCSVKTGNNQTGFVRIHAYNANGTFCVTMTSSKMGQIMAPYCIPIPQQQQQQGVSPKLVTPPSFQIRELQYDTLPHGKLIQSGDNEMIELTMPDGSKIQIGANSTFTPVSDDEVQSVFGRYRYMWQPFHDGQCIVGQNLVRQACRKVKTRDAILGSRGTEFLVDTDEAGTNVTVIEGTLGVTDLNGKKTVEVAGGQSVYIKHGGLPADPKSFDPAGIEHWWEKKTSEQTSQQANEGMVIIIIFGGLILFIIMLIVKRKQIFRSQKKDKQVLAAAAVGAYCVNCGAKISEGASFCTGCGKPLSDVSVGTPVTEKKKRGPLSLLMRVILIIFFLLLMFLLWTFFISPTRF